MEAQHTTMEFSGVKWRDEDAVLAFVGTELRRRDEQHGEHFRQAEINVAWYDGLQDLMWRVGPNGAMGQLVHVPNPRRRVRLIRNMIRPTIDVVISKLGSDNINPEVSPATSDAADIDIAALGTQLCRYYNDLLDLPELEEDCDAAAATTGEVFVKVCWDPAAGAEIDFAGVAEAAGITEADAKAEAKGARTIGEVSVEEVPTQHVHWGPEGAQFEKAEWVLVIHERSRTYVKERYGLDDDEIASGYDGSEVRIFRAEDTGRFGRMSRTPSEDSVIVCELWVKPNTTTCPNGRHVVTIGDKKVLKNEVLPYWHRQIPIVRFPLAKVKGKRHGVSPIVDMIPQQADLNRTISQLAENRETMAQPQIYAKKGSPVDLESWNGVAGGIRLYKTDPPDHREGRGMPASVLAAMEKTIQGIQDSASVRDVSQAKVPASVKSGRAILALQEADNQRLTSIFRRRRRFWQKIYRLILQTARQYVTEERVASIAGEDGRIETITWTGERLEGSTRGPGINYFDVRVRTDGIGVSRAEQLERLDMAMERGAIDPTDPSQRPVILKMMELGITDKMDPSKPHRDAQRLEIMQMMQTGQQIQPLDFEDHEMHQLEANKWLVKHGRDPNQAALAQLVMQHVFLHDIAKAQRSIKLQQVAQIALAQAGMGPAAAQPGQPAAANPPAA